MKCSIFYRWAVGYGVASGADLGNSWGDFFHFAHTHLLGMLAWLGSVDLCLLFFLLFDLLKWPTIAIINFNMPDICPHFVSLYIAWMHSGYICMCTVGYTRFCLCFPDI